MLKKAVLIIFVLALFSGIGYLIFHFAINEKPNQETIKINVYFNNTNLNPNAADCSKVFPLERIIPKTLGTGRAALNELFKGPTKEEKSQGYSSWFSEKTEDILRDIKIEGGTAYVDLKDIRSIIPNVSASCGSAEFLAEIRNTLKQFESVNKVIIAIDGKPSIFYQWIQIGCSEENDFCDETHFNSSDAEAQAKSKIGTIAAETVLSLKNKDSEKLSNLAHPEKGIRFSPYQHVDIEKNIVFSSDQMLEFFKSQKNYIWGIYDGSGESINLTPSAYYNKFIYDVDFYSAPQVSYNRTVGKGNIINNIFESYPGSIVAEYHFPGFDQKYEGMDWRSLHLVFEERRGSWYLVGIVHGQWTI